MQIGAPTVNVPKKPRPITPNLFQILCASVSVFTSLTFGFLYLATKPLILSPKNATTNTPASPPTALAKKIIHADKPIAKPVGIAA